jgi:hypothetical protein
MLIPNKLTIIRVIIVAVVEPIRISHEEINEEYAKKGE